MEKKQYLYLGDNLEFKDFSFSKGVVYFESDKIKLKKVNAFSPLLQIN